MCEGSPVDEHSLSCRRHSLVQHEELDTNYQVMERLQELHDRIMVLAERVAGNLQVSSSFQQAKKYMNEKPLVATAVISMIILCLFPLLMFLGFVFCTLIITFMGFIFVEGTLLTIGTLVLGGALLVGGFFTLFIVGSAAAAYYSYKQALQFTQEAAKFVNKVRASDEPKVVTNGVVPVYQGPIIPTNEKTNENKPTNGITQYDNKIILEENETEEEK